MNKKGFTLIEVLAVIGLLSIVIIIAVPSITNLRNKSLEQVEKNQIKAIESAAIFYAQDNDLKYPITISVEKLISEGYLDSSYNNASYNGVVSLTKGTKVTANFYELSDVEIPSEDIYDVVLFWGQSNMVGRCMKDFQLSEYTGSKDKKLIELGTTEFSNKSQIDIDIVEKYTRPDHVNVDIIPGTVYYFSYVPKDEGASYNSTNKTFDRNSMNMGLTPIFSNTLTIGEDIYYEISSSAGCTHKNKLTNQNYKNSSNGNCANATSEKSSGTNMIPQFGKTYYEKTGHKVVFVYAAIGGKVISRFLPYERNKDEHNTVSKTFNGETYQGEYNQWNAYNATSGAVAITTSKYDYMRYTYEYMISSYKEAINYLTSNNMRIGKKFYVVMQGENDAGLANRNSQLRTKNEYKNLLKEVHDDLKTELNLDFGVIAATSCTTGVCNLKTTDAIHGAQLELVNENNDIILGSDFAYKTFIGNYNLNYKDPSNPNFIKQMSTTDFNTVYNNYNLSRCIVYNSSGEAIVSGTDNNRNHFNSAGLSQIGKEVAISASKRIKGNS